MRVKRLSPTPLKQHQGSPHACPQLSPNSLTSKTLRSSTITSEHKEGLEFLGPHGFLQGRSILVDTSKVRMFNRKQHLINWRRSSVGVGERFSRLSGWRMSAFINTVLVSNVLFVLIFSHLILWAKSGNLNGYHIIHSGKCAEKSVGRLNTLLHLMVNILSSLVLASTNFFMQVLNSPNRAELDSVHEKVPGSMLVCLRLGTPSEYLGLKRSFGYCSSCPRFPYIWSSTRSSS